MSVCTDKPMLVTHTHRDSVVLQNS